MDREHDWVDEVEWTEWFEVGTNRAVLVPMEESEAAAYVAARMLQTERDVGIYWEPDERGLVTVRFYDANGYYLGGQVEKYER